MECINALRFNILGLRWLLSFATALTCQCATIKKNHICPKAAANNTCHHLCFFEKKQWFKPDALAYSWPKPTANRDRSMRRLTIQQKLVGKAVATLMSTAETMFIKAAGRLQGLTPPTSL
jgi:hypothetical protein